MRSYHSRERSVIFLIFLFCGLLPPACQNNHQNVIGTPTPGVIYHYGQIPVELDPDGLYLIYLHGKIIEDQGLPAISPEFGEYHYYEILETFQNMGFTVISERRSAGTDGNQYSEQVKIQVEKLIDAGVSPDRITLVGASKGAGITIFASHLLDHPDINYVLLAICHPDLVEELILSGVHLSGRVLSIYDQGDGYAGSCQDLFAYSIDKGLVEHDEIVSALGLGHGLLYQPYQEWVEPSVSWAFGE